MSVYAIIEDGFVTNLIEWDGESGDFNGAINNQTLGAQIGDAYIDGKLYPMPRDVWGAKYSFDSSSLTWTKTE